MAESHVGTFCLVVGREDPIHQGRVFYKKRWFEDAAFLEDALETGSISNSANDNEDGRRLVSLLKARESDEKFTGIVSSDITFKIVLKKVFDYLNHVEGMSLDINNSRDIARFYAEIQPRKMGAYLGKLHSLGLFHKYAGDKNWLAVGYLCDMDSLEGTLLGDEAITEEDVLRDVWYTTSALYGTSLLGDQVLFTGKEPGQGTFYGFVAQIMGKENAYKVLSVSRINFFRAYCSTRGLSEEQLKKILLDEDIKNNTPNVNDLLNNTGVLMQNEPYRIDLEL